MKQPRSQMCKSRDLKGGKFKRYLWVFPAMWVGDVFERGLSLCCAPKNNARPTISASKNLHYSQHRQSGPDSRTDVSVIPQDPPRTVAGGEIF